MLNSSWLDGRPDFILFFCFFFFFFLFTILNLFSYLRRLSYASFMKLRNLINLIENICIYIIHKYIENYVQFLFFSFIRIAAFSTPPYRHSIRSESESEQRRHIDIWPGWLSWLTAVASFLNLNLKKTTSSSLLSILSTNSHRDYKSKLHFSYSQEEMTTSTTTTRV